jgi:hypothetical protein
LEGGTRGIAGRSFFRGWMRRKTLAETGRPGLLRGLAAFAGVGSLLLVAEGIMVGWFLKHLVASPEPGWPVMRPIDYYFLKMPWVRLPQYLAAACLIMIGAACFMAALSLPGRSRPGTYFAVALEVCLLVTGAILLWQGISSAGTLAICLGAVNMGLGLLVSVLLGLCWYTLDPLGLHGEPD